MQNSWQFDTPTWSVVDNGRFTLNFSSLCITFHFPTEHMFLLFTLRFMSGHFRSLLRDIHKSRVHATDCQRDNSEPQGNKLAFTLDPLSIIFSHTLTPNKHAILGVRNPINGRCTNTYRRVFVTVVATHTHTTYKQTNRPSNNKQI